MKALVMQALEEVNKESKVFSSIDENIEIYNNVDSFLILELILEIEDRLKKKFGRYIQIADEDIMSSNNTPFATFESLVKFVEKKVENG
jgi:acyl carrier protein